jgi:LmbE family N-acetylglucosaminyl deacetylase
MKLSRLDSDVYVPANDVSPDQALARTTHLCVGAHQDDIEIMAHAGITECLGRSDRHFTGVVVTNGSTSPRAGEYANVTDAQMIVIRREEQRKAAALGQYNLQLQLGHSSADVKAKGHAGVFADLKTIFGGCAPEVVYLHQPADKHPTHIGVLLRCLEAIRALPAAQRPKRVLGCEVWRDLDWLLDADKVALDASAQPELALELLKVFASQVAGGKRYDLATAGRRAANATYHTPHGTDRMTAITWAMDLTPLVRDESLSPLDFTLKHVDGLRSDIATRLKDMGA